MPDDKAEDVMNGTPFTGFGTYNPFLMGLVGAQLSQKMMLASLDWWLHGMNMLSTRK